MRIRSVLYAFISVLLIDPSVQAEQMMPSNEEETVVVRHLRNLQADTQNLGTPFKNQDWVENVRLGTLQLPGCTGALVSADGLAVTSAACLRSLESWIRPSDSLFVADQLSMEHRLAGLNVEQLAEINQLVSMDDASSNTSPETRFEVIALEDSSIFWEVTWRIYNDVRLVVIPPAEIAGFGKEDGVYPRYAPDFAFFRVYDESGRPLNTESYFAWSDRPPNDREKLFMTVFDENEPFTSVTLSNTHNYNGTVTPPHTTLYGMLDLHYSHEAAGDWGLPAEWSTKIQQSDLSAALNFSVAGECAQMGVAIVDIDMEILGIAFDDAYTEGHERCVAVSTAGILALLRTVFEAGGIAEELAEQARSIRDDG